jgi:hypothetical protein
MPVAAEVDAFQAEVGGDNQVVSGRRAEHRAVVTDPSDQSTRLM